MIDTKTESSRVTYGELSRALTALGIVRRSTPEFVANWDTEYDPQLVTVRNTVTG